MTYTPSQFNAMLVAGNLFFWAKRCPRCTSSTILSAQLIDDDVVLECPICHVHVDHDQVEVLSAKAIFQDYGWVVMEIGDESPFLA